MLFFENNRAKKTVESWVKMYSTEFYRYAFLRTRNNEEAEEVVQLTFIKAFRSFHTFNKIQNEKAWLYAILSNNLKDRFRQKSEIESINENLESLNLETSESPESLIEKKMELEQLAMGIANLPDHFAQPLLMREIGGMTYKEISEYLDIPIGTVMSRLSRARSALFELLSPNNSHQDVKRKINELQ